MIRTACILIGVLEIADILFQLLQLASTGSNVLIIFCNTKIAVDVLLAVFIIYGVCKRNRTCLKVWITAYIIRVLISPLFYIYCGIDYIKMFVMK